MAVLDIGCGNMKRGDYGIDIDASSDADRLCDAHTLPFPDNSFEVVFSHHVLEHFRDPERVLLEWCRVAKKRIIVYVPYRNHFKRLTTNDPSPKSHKSSFTKGWFYRFAKRHCLLVHVEYRDVFILPQELKAEFFKPQPRRTTF